MRKIVVVFCNRVEKSKWKSKNAKFSKLLTFGILYNKNSSLGSNMKPIRSYSLVSIEILFLTIFIQFAYLKKITAFLQKLPWNCQKSIHLLKMVVLKLDDSSISKKVSFLKWWVILPVFTDFLKFFRFILTEPKTRMQTSNFDWRTYTVS